jgi:hypothetical protein
MAPHPPAPQGVWCLLIRYRSAEDGGLDGGPVGAGAIGEHGEMGGGLARAWDGLNRIPLRLNGTVHDVSNLT